MALLMAQVDPDTICMVGRWRSNTMLRYLHTTAKRFTEGIDAIFFSTAPARLSLPRMSETSARRHSRVLKTRTKRVFWGAGTGSEWSR